MRSPGLSKTGLNRRRTSTSRRRQQRASRGAMTWCAISTVSMILLSLFWSARHSPDGGGGDTHRRRFASSVDHLSQRIRRHGRSSKSNTLQHKMAILLPYTAPSNNAASILPYLTTFCVGAAGAAPLVDFVIFHTGILNEWPNLRLECPPNVIFFNLESHAGMAERLLRVMDDKYGSDNVVLGGGAGAKTDGKAGKDEQPADGEAAAQLLHSDDDQPKMNRKQLLELITSYIKVNPYGLVEFKPALGHIFQDYLDNNNYTHWGYSDFDVLFGDLNRWITLDELQEYDIVTYTYGDQQRLYMRGQFTFHKNDATKINQLWRQCDYLTSMDERFQAIVHNGKQYHVESAEGCYSASIMQRDDVAVKFAVKAWTDIYQNDTAYSHGIFLSRMNRWGYQHVLYKQQQQEPQQKQFDGMDSTPVSRLPFDWFDALDAVYRDRTIPIQSEVGTRQRIVDPFPRSKKEKHCMYWALPKYQSNLCLDDKAVTASDTVFWINGELFTQRFENAALQTRGVITSPLFHFQEWKRAFHAHGPLATMKQSSPVKTYCLAPEGALPMISKTSVAKSPPSPLGLSPISTWNALNKSDDRSQLPGFMYCIVSAEEGSTKTKHPPCDMVVSWHDARHVKVTSLAPQWNELDVEKDVTLVLTMQLSMSQTANLRTLQSTIDHLKVNLQRWRGQPVVAVISLAFSDDSVVTAPKTMELLEERLRLGATDDDLSSSLVAVVVQHLTEAQSDTTHLISRKALLNMAIDAVPTRWYVSGLELERGLSLSADTSFLAHRAAAAHGRLRGTVLIIPQFGLVAPSKETVDESNVQSGPGSHILVSSVEELLSARDKKIVKPLSSFDATCIHKNARNRVDSIDLIETEWWYETERLIDSNSKTKVDKDVAAQRVSSQEKLQSELGKLSSAHLQWALDESPILLVDNLGPHDGIRTSDMVREVETFSGPRCFNGLRLVQLALLGYSFQVLPGAFATSTEQSRKTALASFSTCRSCMNPGKDDNEPALNRIASNELKRAAKTAILWAETMGEKL